MFSSHLKNLIKNNYYPRTIEHEKAKAYYQEAIFHKSILNSSLLKFGDNTILFPLFSVTTRLKLSITTFGLYLFI